MIRKVASTLLFTLTIPLLLWMMGFVLFVSSVTFMVGKELPNPIDGAVVLTGGSNRVNRGLDLLENKKISELLISGVHQDVRMSDILTAWNNKESGKRRKALPCCITLDRKALDTIGNARESREWIEHNNIKSVYLITSNYHMPRALLEFHHQIPGVHIFPLPVQPDHFGPDKDAFWRMVFREYSKYLGTLSRVLFFPDETQSIPKILTK